MRWKQKGEMKVVIIVGHLLSFDLFEVFGRALVQLERCFIFDHHTN